MISNHQEVDVFLGIDEGKSEHRTVALDRTGQKLDNTALPSDVTKMRAVISALARHGKVLFVVD
ncbi:IS110 family transposase [Nesterenkonia sp. Hz 6-5]|nr:IS110 family transposase [Nesterenkonia haasae]